MSTEVSDLSTRARIHAALSEPARLAIVDRLLVSDASPGEIGRLLGQPTNLVAHHLGVLEAAGLIVRSRSEGDRRRSYLRLVPDLLTGLTGPQPMSAPRVVFVCTHNSARSQLAAALLAARASVPTASAGTEPAVRVHPRAVRVGRRHGLSLGRARPVHIDEVIRPDDLVISVCDQAHEHLTARRSDLHWSVPDPARIDTDAAFERAFADIVNRVDRFVPVLEGTHS
jgi:protein-tyrosine-phosphatase